MADDANTEQISTLEESVARKLCETARLDPDRRFYPVKSTRRDIYWPMWQEFLPKAQEIIALIRDARGFLMVNHINKPELKESDAARLNDLASQHGLTFRRAGMIYRFEDFNAYGLDQALGFAEGFDRAVSACQWQAAKTSKLIAKLEGMGFQIERGGGMPLPPSAINTFKKRSGQVEDAAKKLGTRSTAHKAEMVAKLRSRKSTDD